MTALEHIDYLWLARALDSSVAVFLTAGQGYLLQQLIQPLLFDHKNFAIHNLDINTYSSLHTSVNKPEG